MSEGRYCESCQSGSPVCYIKKCEEINQVANEFNNPKTSSETDKMNNALAIENMITDLRDEARKNNCIHVNEIVSDHKHLKDL